MLVGVTGATGFLGRYIVNYLLSEGHRCRCWHRPGSDRGGFVEDGQKIEWLTGELDDESSMRDLVTDCNAVVHAALAREGSGFIGREGDLIEFAQTNFIGSLRLMRTAREAGVERFVFISTCAVHDVILKDRPLDETHPLWPKSHYGAHKAAIEKFVHSFGLGAGWPICSLRPTGIYGIERPVEYSKWYELVRDVVRGRPIETAAGGKEVHAGDVARAAGLLLSADVKTIAGQAYNCYDMYVAEQEVAKIAKKLASSNSKIADLNKGPKNQIDTKKLRGLGMKFGGRPLLEMTVEQLVQAVKKEE